MKTIHAPFSINPLWRPGIGSVSGVTPLARPFTAATLSVLLYGLTLAQLRAQLPPSIDNSAGLPPVKDQGSQHSSHAWALAYYCKTYQEGRARGWAVNTPEHQFSPSFLYNQVAPFDEGTSFAEILPLLADQGCATLADFPYNASDVTTWPPYTAFRNGIPFRIQSYTWLGYGLTPGVIEDIKPVVASGELCVMEVPVFRPSASAQGLLERLNSTNYFYTMPAEEDVYLGSSQALTVVGYDDAAFGGNGGFKVVNSWGTAWGNQGFAWVSCEFIQAFAWDICTMQSRSNYQPTSFARFKLSHTFWGFKYDNVTVTIGVGSETSPLWSKVILTGQEQDSLTVDMAVDLTEATAFLPPSLTNRCWIKIDDSSREDVGKLTVFDISINGTNYSANVVMPLTGPFFSGRFFAYLPAGDAVSANYYVNDDRTNGDVYCTSVGNDTNDGLTPATPKRSAQAIIDHYALKAGDTVWIDAGLYALTNDVQLTQLDRAADGNPIRFVGVIAPNGEPATILDRGTNGGACFTLNTGARFIQLENVWLKRGANGVNFDGSWDYGTDGLILKNARVSNTASDAVSLYEAGGVSLQNCILNDFAGNYGLNVVRSSVTLSQSTIAAPTNRTCAGLFSSSSDYASDAELTMTNSILTAAGSSGRCVVQGNYGYVVAAKYNDLRASGGGSIGFTPDSSNLQVEPLFADPATGDFHLKSTAGRWDPAASGGAGGFVIDDVDSACIDAGDPFVPVGNEPIHNGARVNIGAYGGTAYASKSPANRRYLFIERPGTGEVCRSNYLIAWRESGGGWQAAETLLAEFSSDAGQIWQPIPSANSLPFDSLSFSWNTLGLPEGTNYLVRLTSNLDGGTVVTNGGLFVIAYHPRNFYVNDGFTTNDVYCTAPGNDGNDGLSSATPKASVQAILDTYDLEPGDTVLVDTGVYVLTNNILVPASDSGSSDAYVRIVGSTNASGSVFDRGNANAGTACFEFSNSDFVSLENVECRRGYDGVLVDEYNRSYRFVNLYLHGNSNWGLEAPNNLYNGQYASLYVWNCLVVSNSIGGVYTRSHLACFNSTIAHNGPYPYGGQIGSPVGASITVRNCIIGAAGATGSLFYVAGSGLPSLSSDYNDFFTGNGAVVSVTAPSLPAWRAATGQDAHSLSADPLFVNAVTGDYHLQSTGGSWHGGAFTPDPSNSPCIDAGNPATPLGAEPAPNGGRINLGAYGGTAQASKTPSGRVLTIVTPNGSEIWRGTNDIIWLTTGQGWNSDDTLRLEYSGDGGTTWNAIAGASALAYINGQFGWNTLPIPSGARYRVRATCNQNPATADVSDANFTIHNTGLSFYVNDAFTTNDVYCTTAGSDANDGLSAGTPKASVQAILDAYHLQGDDTILVDTGLYASSNAVSITSPNGGGPEGRMTLKGSPYGSVFQRLGPSDGYLPSASAAIDVSSPSVGFEQLTFSGSQLGLRLNGNGVAVRNCLFVSNYVGVLHQGNISAGITNCTFVANTDAVFVWYYSGLDIRDCIFDIASPSAYGINVPRGRASSDYNCFHLANGGLAGYYGGTAASLADWQSASGDDLHSLSADPLFVNAAGGDYHLQSTGGSWHGATFAADPADSRCIDAGDPAVPVGAEPAPNGGRINLGAYGGTAQASKTPSARVLTIVTPNGSEIWRGTNNIIWLTTGQGWNSDDTLRLEYSGDGGTTWNAIAGASALAYINGQFGWNTLPIPSGARYRVRATCNQNLSTQDSSDASFTIHNTGLNFYVNDGFTTNDVYCTTVGNDTNDGLSPATPKATIQALLDAIDLEPGDTVLVDAGTYALTNDITVSAADSGNSIQGVPGRTVLVRAGTSGSSFQISSSVAYVAIEGFELRGGGYGVYSPVNGSGPTLLKNNLFNRVGVYIYRGTATLLNNTFYEAGYAGDSGNTTLRNNIFALSGSGKVCVSIWSSWASPDNYVNIYDYNCYYVTEGAAIGYAESKDVHRLTANPLFVDTANNDFHLQSTAGSWHGGAFTADANDSPCIDAGDPVTPVGEEPAPNGARLNLGAYGGTAQASKSTRILALDTPAGGEFWRLTGTIRWTVNGMSWPTGETVSLFYSPNDGTNWYPISGAAGLLGTVQHFDWDLSNAPASTHYRVRVVHDQAPADTGSSPSPFTVAGNLPFASGNVYFVNDSNTAGDQFCLAPGSSSNDGLTAATPKDGLHAILNAYDLEPGDTVFVDVGTYSLTNNVFIGSTNAGSAAGLVHILGVKNKTILDRGAADTGGASCLVIGAPYVSVENLTCLRAYYGIQVNANNCSLLNNTVSGCGYHGIYINSVPNTVLAHNVVAHSGAGAAINLAATYYGGGDYASVPCSLVNNTVVATNADGIATIADGGPQFKNNIVRVSGSGRCCISARDITGISSSDFNDLYPQDGAQIGGIYQASAPDLFTWRALSSWDAHSFSVEPLFADSANSDFHLQSANGRFDPSAGKPPTDPTAWVTDATTSLAIDAGDLTDAVGNESLPNGGRINLGAFGGTAEASRSSTATRIVNMLSPNGGEIWSGFEAIELRTSGSGFQFGDTLILEYSDDGGTTWHTMPGGGSVPAAQTRFWWDTRTAANSSNYRVRATSAQDGSAQDLSDTPFRIANLVAPLILTQPQSQSIPLGSNATFSVTLNDTIFLSYQWRKNGTNIAGATNAVLSLPNASLNDTGTYTVLVANPAGFVTSDPATLTVLAAPVITTQPVSQTGSFGDSVSFTVTATGTAPLSYQWRKGGTNITSAANNRTLTLNSVTANDSGSYSVVITNVVGSVTSSVVTLTVVVRPPNDNFANRIVIMGLVSTVTGSNVNATVEPGEPYHYSSTGGKSVWWTWTAPASGPVTMDTIDSSFDTIMAVYTNNTLATLGRVASDDDSGGNNTSRVLFSAIAGTGYQIAVDGYNGASGNITLSARLNIPTLGTPSRMANGQFQFQLSGPVGSNYVIQASTNLTTWTTIATNVIPASGSVPITDPFAANYSQRFYRAVSP